MGKPGQAALLHCAAAACPLTLSDIEDAAARLERFAPYLAAVFPETAATGGIIESLSDPSPDAKGAGRAQRHPHRRTDMGQADSHLPISGSIKARGGIYEVLKPPRTLPLHSGNAAPDRQLRRSGRGALPQAVLAVFHCRWVPPEIWGFPSASRAQSWGFRSPCICSADARQWKKDLLRSRGVKVVEYASDYSIAVTEGRKLAASAPTATL